MKFSYQAVDKSGRKVEGVVEAGDAADATELLRKQDLFVTRLAEARAGRRGGGRGAGARRPGRGRRLRHVAVFTRQLFVLVSTGTPLAESLGALRRQFKPGHWQEVIKDLHARVEEGSALSAAMERHADYFDPIYRNMIAAGESGGQLDHMLERLAVLTRKQLHVRNAIAGAMVYPCLLTFISLGVLALMLTFVLPRFAEMFKNLDAPLPATTKALMAAGEALRRWWWALLLGAAGAGAAARLWLATPAGRRARDTALLAFPKIGSVARNLITARVVRVLGVLITSKVPMLEALRLVRQGAGNVHYAALVARAEELVTRGEPMSAAFADTRLVAGGIYEVLRNGEKNGQIGTLLLNMADFLDEENEVVVRSLTSVVEPLILVVLGLLVGLVALSMFMPLFDLTSMTHGGG